MGKGLEVLALLTITTGGVGVIGAYAIYKVSDFVTKMASDKANIDTNYNNASSVKKRYGKKEANKTRV